MQILREFVWLPTFERTAKKLLNEQDRRAIEETLLRDPRTGVLLRGTRGFRKMRYAIAGAGKSGGARIIYFFDEPCDRFFMLMAFPKARKASLTEAEKNELSEIASALKSEDC